ncbi:MAG TPA: lysylphosphatidylglycerol synthase transmembrane domain-containing protein [Gaiellaceae bacterium]|nr:lysylphosphatidylglycerol synthase transmembrane domain-containing protein [Gaiellaceae bacterium]
MADEDDEILGFERRKALLAVGLAVVLAVVAFGLIGKVADYGKLLSAVERANRVWFPLAFGGEVLAYVGYILAYRDVARADGGPCFGIWTVTRIVGLGFGAFVVGSSVGGLAVDFWALKRAGEHPHEAARRVLALNTFEWGVLSWLAVGAGIAVLAGRGAGAPLGMCVGWIVVVPICSASALYVSQPGRLERLEELGGDRQRPRRFAPRAWARWLWNEAKIGLGDAIGGVGVVRHMVARPRRHFGGLLGFPVYWAGDLITLYAGLRAFGAHIAPTPLILAYATAYVLTALPLPAGGAGSMEAVVALTLHAVGVPLAPALLAAFLYRIFAFWLPILPALALLPGVGRLNEDLPRAAR